MLHEIKEFAHNAISYVWDAKPENDKQNAKVFISTNCLSTDFSAQKGIKGMALLLQIDSHCLQDDGTWKCVHRGASQIKVFCDKGAERKIRDEERKANKENPMLQFQNKREEHLCFLTMNTLADIQDPPFYFQPEIAAGRAMPEVNTDPTGKVAVSQLSEAQPQACEKVFSPPPAKKARPASPQDANKENMQPASKPVLLYIREENDEVFDGVMLTSPTKQGLLNALNEKYGIEVNKVKKLYKKNRKGITVKIDDNILQHYSNEDTFCLYVSTEADGNLKVVLSEIES